MHFEQKHLHKYISPVIWAFAHLTIFWHRVLSSLNNQDLVTVALWSSRLQIIRRRWPGRSSWTSWRSGWDWMLADFGPCQVRKPWIIFCFLFHIISNLLSDLHFYLDLFNFLVTLHQRKKWLYFFKYFKFDWKLMICLENLHRMI